jgi:glycosyltransferase 2 family protein
MDKKRILASVVVFLILAVLVYLQYRHWRTFDWATFWGQIHRVTGWRIALAVALTYLSYVLRALRWKIFLSRVKPDTKVSELVSATLVGFTGVALLGRAGEFIRPYLIARRTQLPFSSQLAVWTVERAFDVGSVAVMMIVAVFAEGGMPSILQPKWYRTAYLGVSALTLFALGIVVAAFVINQKGEAVARWVEQHFQHSRPDLASSVALRVKEFRAGLNTIHGLGSFFLLSLVSVGIWCVIALAYIEITRSYNDDSLRIWPLQILILMGASMAGSMLQLPAVGGGSQMATIATLSSVFDVPAEMAASCGILLWIVTFASVVPAGLLLAHRERLSLRKLSVESHQAEEAEIEQPTEKR